MDPADVARFVAKLDALAASLARAYLMVDVISMNVRRLPDGNTRVIGPDLGGVVQTVQYLNQCADALFNGPSQITNPLGE